MDGLLRSEFALVLRDSLNSTPRRHVLPSPPPPPPPAVPSSPKKPRAADFGIRCDMQLEPRLQFAPFPTSPTSPLPATKLTGSPVPAAVPASKIDSHLPSPGNLAFLRKDLSPSPQSHSIAKSKRTIPLAKRLQASNLHSPPSSPPPSSSMSARPLDVLASVSVEQQVQTENANPTRVHPSAMRPLDSRRLAALPTSPVNSESVAPIFADDKKKPKQRSAKATSPTGKSSTTGRIFSCTQCTSTFSQQFNLNKHIRAVHERRRPFQCDVCHARFQQKSHRTMHQLAVHEKLRQYACDQCNASFSWRGVLKKHRKSIHRLDD